MNKVIALGKLRKKTPAQGVRAFLRDVTTALEAFLLIRHWESPALSKEEKMNILCSLVVPESFFRDPFYNFLVKACSDPEVKVRMAAVNALNGEKYLDSVSTEMFKEILSLDDSVDIKKLGRPRPEHLRLLYDIYNKFFQKGTTDKVLLLEVLLKIENPRSEDLPFLIKQLKFNTNLYATLNKVAFDTGINIKKRHLTALSGNVAITLIGRMGSNGVEAIPALFEGVDVFKQGILRETFRKICPPTQKQIAGIDKILEPTNDPFAIEMAAFCLNSGALQIP